MLVGAVVVVIVWKLDLQLPVQSVPITTKVVSSNPAHSQVYSIQHFVIKFVNDFLQVGGFLKVLTVSSTNKTDRHDVAEILLKVALNTINLTIIPSCPKDLLCVFTLNQFFIDYWVTLTKSNW